MGKGVEGSPHPDSGHVRSCGVGRVEYLVRVEGKALTPRLNHPGPCTVKPVTVQRCPLLVPQELAEGVGSSPFRSATDNLEFRKDFYFFFPRPLWDFACLLLSENVVAEPSLTG